MTGFTRVLLRPTAQAFAVFGGIIGFLVLTLQAISYFYTNFSTTYVQVGIAVGAIIFVVAILMLIFSQTYGKVFNRKLRLVRGGVSYKYRMLYAAQLCCESHVYFQSVIFMKVGRVFTGLIFISMMLYPKSFDGLSLSFKLIGHEINVQQVFQLCINVSSVSLLIFVLFTLTEISLISRIVAVHLANRGKRDLRAHLRSVQTSAASSP